MANKPGLLARLFGRTQNSVVAKLYTHALGTPLLVHPAMGERLIGAYLEGAVDAPDSVVASSGSIAVINVSGGLVNRPMRDACGSGPTSYEELRCAFDEAMSDENVTAIVFRMDSPGGMASGCFDLADYIFESRGKKPIVAQVDDMAYSGAYALAAACDEIQMTRTGGVGSVGVYTYHIDQSGYDSKMGVKVTYIFAGAKKVDGNPHEPMSDSAMADAQADINETYDLFVNSVAKYRGMSADDVRATEAQCYGPADALVFKLADSIGTLEDLVERLSKIEVNDMAVTEPKFKIGDRVRSLVDHMPGMKGKAGEVSEAHAGEPPYYAVLFDGEEEPHKWLAENELEAEDATSSEEEKKPMDMKNNRVGNKDLTAEQIAAAALQELAEGAKRAALTAEDAAVQMTALVAAVKAAKLPAEISMALIKRGPSGTPDEMIANANAIRDLCAAAKIETAAADYIAAGTSIETVRKELSAAVADTGNNELVTVSPPGGQQAGNKPVDSQSIYKSRRKAK